MHLSPKLLSLLCALASCACLAAGIAQPGLAIGSALVSLCFWLVSWRWTSPGWVSLAFFFSTTAAVTGSLAGGDGLWMVAAITLALAAWDLAHFGLRLGASPGEQAARVAGSHYRMLGLVLFLGLGVATAGRLLALQIPLAGVILLVILIVVALDRAWKAVSS